MINFNPFNSSLINVSIFSLYFKFKIRAKGCDVVKEKLKSLEMFLSLYFFLIVIKPYLAILISSP